VLRIISKLFLAAVFVSGTAVVSLAQQTSTATQTKSFEVIAVSGNNLVVRLPEGTRELSVPDDFRFTVNGQSMSVHEMMPGMKGSATITTRTTTTPVTVTQVKNGTVMQAAAGTIIVRTPEGVKSFNQGDVNKRGVQIMRDGKPAEVSDFRAGDKLSAVIITAGPPHVLTQREVNATLAAAPAPAQVAAGPAPAPRAAAPASAPAAESTVATRTLPKTASSWPLLAFASLLSLALGGLLTARRRFAR
jgi:LPXTG-motif cell wall-anchored protein